MKRVAFTTFHQSMDYEDWIEGLRPVISDNGQVTYEIENGIFKKLCDEATRPTVTDKHVGISNNSVIWKVSLAGTGDNPVRSDCMKNGYIRIGGTVTDLLFQKRQTGIYITEKANKYWMLTSIR